MTASCRLRTRLSGATLMSPRANGKMTSEQISSLNFREFRRCFSGAAWIGIFGHQRIISCNDTQKDLSYWWIVRCRYICFYLPLITSCFFLKHALQKALTRLLWIHVNDFLPIVLYTKNYCAWIFKWHLWNFLAFLAKTFGVIFSLNPIVITMLLLFGTEDGWTP